MPLDPNQCLTPYGSGSPCFNSVCPRVPDADVRFRDSVPLWHSYAVIVKDGNYLDNHFERVGDDIAKLARFNSFHEMCVNDESQERRNRKGSAMYWATWLTDEQVGRLSSDPDTLYVFQSAILRPDWWFEDLAALPYNIPKGTTIFIEGAGPYTINSEYIIHLKSGESFKEHLARVDLDVVDPDNPPALKEGVWDYNTRVLGITEVDGHIAYLLRCFLRSDVIRIGRDHAVKYMSENIFKDLRPWEGGAEFEENGESFKMMPWHKIA